MEKLLSLLVNGLMSFSTILAVSLGMAIICGKMKLFNLAHGELVMIGAYIAYVTVTVCKLPFCLSIFFAFAAAFLLGVVIEKVLIKPFYSRPEETLLVTFGLSLVLQEVMKFIFKSAGKSVAMPVKGVITAGSVIIPVYNFVVLGISAGMLAVTWILFYGTSLGKKIRAIGQNRQMTECLGVNTSFYDTVTFAYGCALTGVAGVLLAPLKSITPSMGTAYLLDSFMTVVTGGVDSLAGTAAASFGIGEMTAVIGGYLDSVSARLIVFLVIIVLIRFRPEGLFARERR